VASVRGVMICLQLLFTIFGAILLLNTLRERRAHRGDKEKRRVVLPSV